MTIENSYQSAKQDIKDCWENPLRGSQDRITREWIYSCEMSTHAFCKAVWSFIPDHGNLSLYDVFVKVMRSKSLESLMTKK